MPWLKVDDGLHAARKVVKIPRRRRMAAMGLWIIAASWCASNLTDGYLADHEIDELGGSSDQAQWLVDSGLWERTEGGYQFHDWSDYQPARAEVLAKRDAEAERKRIARQRPRGQKPDSAWTNTGVRPDDDRTPLGQTPESEHPDPTRPDPTLPTSNEVGAPRMRGHRLGDDFVVTDQMVAWAREKAPAVDGKRATEMFTNHWQSATGRTAVKSDWQKAWRNWLLSDQQRAEERGWKPDESKTRRTFNDNDD